ncbi:General secretion pathway protein D / Type II secretion outermembrane pore forming protein (PulD) [Chondromyces apiculatus DSM 436]|uniref:General secretion pathway protein D / Type II secretion outermembrane pore forming protein (PulD) n=2 Tax=Chondromyces apiculatus TaxID=51 RepID=A0A017T248_9BACT|nr:General secretion pathway protein D / Type II secretion outermembrane pore forming protein (PulD) [Chondromyces apiculatus DSM 436]
MRLVSTSALALALWGASPAAHAQPARGAPVLRTPAQRQVERPPAAGGSPRAQAPGAAVAPPAPAPGAASGAGDDDPMASVKQGVQEIEFKPKPGGYRVSFNLEEAELPELVKAISNITGRRFIYGGKLRQIKASVYAPEKVTVGEAYSAFLSILHTNGMTVIPHGRFLKIVETQGIVNDTTPVFNTAAPVPDEDRYVTRLYRLSNVDATDASGVLTKFKSKDGDVSVYAPGNLLIITDTGANIQRMLQIVEAIDVGGAGEQLWVQPVHYASAADMATKLGEILDPSKASGGAGGRGGAGGGAAGKSRIIADDRTNSLILTATEPDYMRVLSILKRLDVPQTGEGQIHVLPLQHALCKDLSTTLNQILGGSGGASSGAAVGGRGARGGAGQAGPPIPGSAETLFEGQIKVTCDEASNKLVVTSSMRDYAQLRGVIDELDMPRRQVFIEAVIMDVSVERVRDWGVGYHGGAPFSTLNTNDAFIYGGNNPGQSILGVPANLEALALGIRGPEIEGSNNLLGTGVSIPALGVVLHWLADNGDSNVLATPHIIATDNEEAEISIGQNIPLQTNVGGSSLGSLAGLAGGAAGAAGALGGVGSLLGGFGGFAAPRQDVGTTITITPHINDSDLVRMEIAEEISDAGTAVGALGAIPINKRTASTILTVKDQQTVVIGGLVRDVVLNAETKIPVLGDLPVLGFLFKQSKRTTTKSNLLLVLTPYVIRNQDDLRAIFERKMEERQEFIDRYFVFSDSRAWEPPRDWGRQNGLVEDIRQSMIKEEERARLEEESRPKDRMEHTAVEPIGMPSFGAKSPEDTPGAAAPQDQGESAPRLPRTPRVRTQRARPQAESVE